MNYPVAVLVVASVVSGILLIKVVPQFEEIFAGFGAELPEFTQMVVDMSRWMTEWWFAIIAGLAAVYFSYKEAHKRSVPIQEGQERLSLKMPILGDILDKSCIARFARTLSTTFAAGVPLVDALESVSGAAGNVVYRNAILEIKEAVEGGGQLNTSMKDTNVFPNMVIQMVAIGEESGSLDGMLDKAATYYEEMVDNMVDGLTSLMEPIIMSFLGVVIGGLIIAMYLPIFSMGDAIGGSGH
jgi:type IV pilus assembly protein PilC